MLRRNPKPAVVELTSLRPTQLTVGMREVVLKRKEWRGLSKSKRNDYLLDHVAPIVSGPKDHAFIVDHHHLALALRAEGHDSMFATPIANLDQLDKGEFWTVMDHSALVHPYDAHGRRVGFDAIPKRLSGLVDDPYRSLAAAVRRHGGYDKVAEPFEDFVWADFLRRRIPRKLLVKDFEDATARGLEFAKTPAARHLPGLAALKRAVEYHLKSPR